MCTCPNYMVWNGDFTKNDRPKLKFVGHHEFDKILKATNNSADIPFIQVPCGKCLECRIQYARTWSDRCVLEAQNSPFNYFVTLTYDDEHLPPKASLDDKAMARFMNLVRKYFKRKLGFQGKIRFLGCGEYGDKSFRPHYHILLFNCPIPDLSYSFYQEVDGKMVRYDRPPSKNNDLMFSRIIYDLWINEEGEHLGQISVGHFSYDTAAYVAQYVTKKCNPNSKHIYDELGIYPEFLRMSNRPGIGASYFDKNPQLHDQSKIIIPCDGEAHLSSIPRYYDHLFQVKYGDDVFAPIQIKRVKKKFGDIDTYLHSKSDYEEQARLRDYNIHKIHHDKTTL